VANEIEQVLLNLLKNAAHAMQDSADERAPCLTLRTRGMDDWAQIEVEDNGPGMSDAVRKRVFEPFFTTKASGTGTGLGLSVSYTIVSTNHKGTMTVDSVQGKGTTFTIRLPLQRTDP
jgi:signal transduction histidine kinase